MAENKRRFAVVVEVEMEPVEGKPPATGSDAASVVAAALLSWFHNGEDSELDYAIGIKLSDEVREITG